ncbi:GTP cyclohydrolase II [Actinomyces sp. 2119]|uniref:GTP cyclohydrolase-2 n=2 Tax=Actinomycetaceae TaxID=2049 RepID=A0ABM6Z710_9ACTO|nr:GTP cyclohydrolase II [Actinomyces lilanjuaniae]RJF41011.1 GTP cyclohydrolase II [Actinomyces sp. 2119]
MAGVVDSSMERVLSQLSQGRPVVVVDDEARENEGDLVLAAQRATPETMGMLVRYTSGLICAPLTAERARVMRLPVMVEDGEDPRGTAYTVSCDARAGTTTGISAHDRCLTVRALLDTRTGPEALIRPGHVLPLVARAGGVLERAGHTEAAVDLCRLAGLEEVAAIGELVNDDGSLMRAAALRAFADEHDLAVVSIARLQEYRRAVGDVEEAGAPARGIGEAQGGVRGARAPGGRAPLTAPPVRLPTEHGVFTAVAWGTGSSEHLSLTAPVTEPGSVPLVRVHSECLTGDVMGSRRCDCGRQLDRALEMVQEQGGAVIYLRDHEGRGIGLVNKMRAYHEQDNGADTVEANEVLGLPVDARTYSTAADILRSLGLTRVRLLTNNPSKVSALEAEGIEVVGREPIEVGAHPESLRYLRTKRDRMHHHLTHLGRGSSGGTTRRQDSGVARSSAGTQQTADARSAAGSMSSADNR